MSLLINQENTSKGRMDQLENIRNLIPIIELMLKPEQAMDIVLHLVRDILDHESGVLFLIDTTTGQLNTVSIYGDFIDLASSVPFSSGHGLSSWVVKEKRPILLSEVQRRRERPDDPVRSFMSIPIMYNKNILGVMNFGHSKSGAFDKKALNTVIDATDPLGALIQTLLVIKPNMATQQPPSNPVEIESERLTAVKQTVVSLNHEINNPLAAMLLATELLLRSIPDDDDKMKQQLTVIKKEADRISEFVKSLSQIQMIAVKDYIPGVIQMLDIQKSINGMDSN